MLPNGFKLGAPGAVLVILCFFLPWVLVSCGNETPKLQSGWDIGIGAGSTEPGYHGNPFVFVILLTGLVVGTLAFSAFRRGHLNVLDGLVPIILGVVCLLFLYLQFGRPGEGVKIEYQPGFWGTVVGLLAIATGGVLNFLDRRKNSKPTNEMQR